MPQRVWTDAPVDASLVCPKLHDEPEALAGQAVPPLIQEKRFAWTSALKTGSPVCEVIRYGLLRRHGKADFSGPARWARAPQRTIIKIDIPDVEGHQLAHSKPRMVEQSKHGPVAKGIGALARAARLQQRPHFFRAGRARSPPLNPRRAQRGGRVFASQAAGVRVSKEGFDRGNLSRNACLGVSTIPQPEDVGAQQVRSQAIGAFLSANLLIDELTKLREVVLIRADGIGRAPLSFREVVEEKAHRSPQASPVRSTIGIGASSPLIGEGVSELR